MQGFSHRLQDQYPSTPQRGKWETVWGFRDGSDSRPLQPHYPHHSGAFHQHALHDEATARQKVRAIGQRGTQATATLQEREFDIRKLF